MSLPGRYSFFTERAAGRAALRSMRRCQSGHVVDCNSTYGGSNPSRLSRFRPSEADGALTPGSPPVLGTGGEHSLTPGSPRLYCGCSSGVERLLAKQKVVV